MLTNSDFVEGDDFVSYVRTTALRMLLEVSISI